MSYSFADAGVRHGPCVVIAKYASPFGLSGFWLSAWSSGAFDVVPTYFTSAAISSGAWMQPVVTAPPQLGNAPLVACSSNPATIELIELGPVPWLIAPPLSGSEAVCTFPFGSSSEAGWGIVAAGRGA